MIEEVFSRERGGEESSREERGLGRVGLEGGRTVKKGVYSWIWIKN
jgi:hypothetical protein